jgi:hypothetical protein
MVRIKEGNLTFEFPNGWTASKFDEWSFYKSQFSKLGEAQLVCSKCEGVVRCSDCSNRKVAGTKGIDILAIDPSVECWCIEIKDYRINRREKPSELADEVALKVRDTLAALAAARINANDDDEKRIAAEALKCRQLHVVLHLEQPVTGATLFPRSINPANVMQRLKQLIKCIDPHARVVEMHAMSPLEWSVA